MVRHCFSTIEFRIITVPMPVNMTVLFAEIVALPLFTLIVIGRPNVEAGATTTYCSFP